MQVIEDKEITEDDTLVRTVFGHEYGEEIEASKGDSTGFNAEDEQRVINIATLKDAKKLITDAFAADATDPYDGPATSSAILAAAKQVLIDADAEANAGVAPEDVKNKYDHIVVSWRELPTLVTDAGASSKTYLEGELELKMGVNSTTELKDSGGVPEKFTIRVEVK